MTLNLLPAGRRGIPIGELARQLNLKPATVAQTINSLEERGLVNRHRGERDKRQVLLHITVKGSRLQNTAAGQFKKQMASIFSSMDAGKRAELISGLEQFVSVGRVYQSVPTRKGDGGLPAEHSS